MKSVARRIVTQASRFDESENLHDMRRTRILAVVDYYLPGCNSGGPVRTIANMVQLMSGEFDFWIFTRDRDFGDREPYPGVRRDEWNNVGEANVYYWSQRGSAIVAMARAIRTAVPDIVYPNSVFSGLTVRYLAARRCGVLPRAPCVVAPRGELSPGALRLKTGKKKLFLGAATAAGLYNGVVWQASTGLERSEIRSVLGERCDVQVARDVYVPPRAGGTGPGERTVSPKQSGTARFVYLSRITAKKNLLFAIERLREVRGRRVELDVYGPIDDEQYWQRCLAAAESSPRHVVITYRGPVQHADVYRVFGSHDFFLFPTLGENFGHAIAESLMSGCPVVLARTTPWRDLERSGAGWDIPLDDHMSWEKVLQTCVDMDAAQHAGMAVRAPTAALSFTTSYDVVQGNIALFRWALAS